MKSFWTNKKVLVTGGAGFIGSHVVEKLVARQADVTVFDNLSHGKISNLNKVKNKIKVIQGVIDTVETSKKACKGQDVVMNLAAKVGGIGYNNSHQGTMLFNNLLISSVMIEAARLENVKRFLVVSSACVYSSTVSIPTPEKEGFDGEPDPTNSGYGWGKRMAELLGKYYAREFDMNIAVVRPYNCYGPRDHFETGVSHVIPALIKRVYTGENPIRVWGSGNQTRAFLYVEDLAEGMILAVEKSKNSDPINLGTDEEVSIKQLVKLIIQMSGLKCAVQFDTSKPDGSPRRNSDNTKARKTIGFNAKTNLKNGLKHTIEWYKKYGEK